MSKTLDSVWTHPHGVKKPATVLQLIRTEEATEMSLTRKRNVQAWNSQGWPTWSAASIPNRSSSSFDILLLPLEQLQQETRSHSSLAGSNCLSSQWLWFWCWRSLLVVSCHLWHLQALPQTFSMNLPSLRTSPVWLLQYTFLNNNNKACVSC